MCRECDGHSRRSSRPGRCDWCLTRARRSPRWRGTWTCRHRLGPVGVPSTCRSQQGQDWADDGGARGAGAAPQREPRAADGARHPKKSRGLLREGERVRFAFIDAEKADYPITRLCRALSVSRAGLLRLARTARVEANWRRPAADGPGPRSARGEPRELRQPSRARGASGPGRTRESQAGGPADAPGKASRPACAAGTSAPR